jgi:site-specific DNA-cytosine methylase
LQGNIAPRRQEGEKVAPTVTTGAPFSRTRNESVECEAIVAQCLTTRTGSAFDPFMETMPIAFSSKQQSMKTSDNVANTLGANDYKEPQAVAISCDLTWRAGDQANAESYNNLAGTLNCNKGQRGGIIAKQDVRRLTPIECERLQGFPDNYTDIRLNDKQTPDGPRYKAMGNSMAVPVMNWIGRRIQMVEDTE